MGRTVSKAKAKADAKPKAKTTVRRGSSPKVKAADNNKKETKTETKAKAPAPKSNAKTKTQTQLEDTKTAKKRDVAALVEKSNNKRKKGNEPSSSSKVPVEVTQPMGDDEPASGSEAQFMDRLPRQKLQVQVVQGKLQQVCNVYSMLGAGLKFDERLKKIKEYSREMKATDRDTGGDSAIVHAIRYNEQKPMQPHEGRTEKDKQRMEKINTDNDKKSAQMLKILLENCTSLKPEELSIRNDYGTTPLLIAVRLDKPECVQLLVNYGADIDQADQHKLTVSETANKSTTLSSRIREIITQSKQSKIEKDAQENEERWNNLLKKSGMIREKQNVKNSVPQKNKVRKSLGSDSDGRSENEGSARKKTKTESNKKTEAEQVPPTKKNKKNEEEPPAKKSKKEDNVKPKSAPKKKGKK